MLLLFLFVVSRVFLYATPVEYEPNTLIITLKNDRPSVSPANYIHHQPHDDPPLVSPEKIMSSLQEKWGASSYSIPFNSDVITPYAAIIDPNKKTPPTEIIIASFPKNVDITSVKQDYQMRPSVRNVEFNYYVYINQNEPHLLPVHERQYHIQDLSLVHLCHIAQTTCVYNQVCLVLLSVFDCACACVYVFVCLCACVFLVHE